MLQRTGFTVFAGILIFLALPTESSATGAGASDGAARPNILLITIDSMRADRMGFAGARARLTPHLDELAQRSYVFEHAYAQAPATVASTATILTGAYPQIHGAGDFGALLPSTLPYLPDLLHKAGFSTAAFVGTHLLDPMGGPFQRYDRGFDKYEVILQRSDDEVVRAIAWLKTMKGRPFFLWANLDDPESTNSRSYDRAIAAADTAAGKLIDFLRSQSLYNNAVIVVASSHGESLGAHGEDTHGIFLYDETIHVPLLLKLPGIQAPGKQINNRVRLLDVAPTLLEAAGVPVPSQMQGQSLKRIAQAGASASAFSGADQPAYARSELPRQGFGCARLESWRVGKYLYIRAPEPELYDLSADPQAGRNLALSSKATLDTLASQLQALDNRLGTESGKLAGPGLTSSEQQKLASLGYVGLQKTGNGVDAGATGADPKQVITFINKTVAAISELDKKNPDKAAVLLRPVLAAHPTFYLAQYGMGAALVQQQKYAEGMGYLHKAIELQPDSPWAHYEMGLSLLKTGDFKAGAVHLEIAAGHLPEFSALHSELAEIYDHLGRKDDAARERRRAAPKGM